MLRNLRHIGIVVNDLTRAIDTFSRTMGLNFTETIKKDDIGVEIAFAPVGGTLIELLQYKKHKRGKGSIVRRQKGALNHICFEVDNLEEAIKCFEKRGLTIAEGYPRDGAHGKVAFFDPRTTEGVLIEICQIL